MLPNDPNQPTKKTAGQPRPNGTGFPNTLLSSQRTTTHHQNPTRGPSRATNHTQHPRTRHFYYLTSPSLVCQTVYPGLSYFVRFGTRWAPARSPSRLTIGFGRPAACGLPLTRPVPAGRYLTRSVSPHQIGLPADSADTARPATSEGYPGEAGATWSGLRSFGPVCPFRAGREKVTRIRVHTSNRAGAARVTPSLNVVDGPSHRRRTWWTAARQLGDPPARTTRCRATGLAGPAPTEAHVRCPLVRLGPGGRSSRPGSPRHPGQDCCVRSPGGGVRGAPGQVARPAPLARPHLMQHQAPYPRVNRTSRIRTPIEIRPNWV